MRNRLPCSIGFPPLPDRDSHQRGHLVGIGLGSNRITQLQVCAPGLHRGQPTDSKSAKCCDARLSRPTRKKDPSSWALRFRVVRSRGWTSPFRFPQSHSSAMLGLLKHVALADRTGKARLRSLELGCTLPVPAFCPRRCTLSQPTETETSTPRFGQLRRAVRIVVEFVFSTSFPVSFPGCFS